MTDTNKPIETIRLTGGVRVKLWANNSKDGRVYITADVARTYKTRDGFGDSSSYGMRELLVLAKAADLAYERGLEIERTINGVDTGGDEDGA